MTNPRGYLSTRIARRGRGSIRILWIDPVTGGAPVLEPRRCRVELRPEVSYTSNHVF